MLAAILPAARSQLELERIPIPAPRRGEVLVKVSACGVCHTDLHVMKGEVAFPTPAVLGHEISGVVVELGEGGGVVVSRPRLEPSPDHVQPDRVHAELAHLAKVCLH